MSLRVKGSGFGTWALRIRHWKGASGLRSGAVGGSGASASSSGPLKSSGDLAGGHPVQNIGLGFRVLLSLGLATNAAVFELT